jgi:hypothetical protein
MVDSMEFAVAVIVLAVGLMLERGRRRPLTVHADAPAALGRHHFERSLGSSGSVTLTLGR